MTEDKITDTTQQIENKTNSRKAWRWKKYSSTNECIKANNER